MPLVAPQNLICVSRRPCNRDTTTNISEVIEKRLLFQINLRFWWIKNPPNTRSWDALSSEICLLLLGNFLSERIHCEHLTLVYCLIPFTQMVGDWGFVPKNFKRFCLFSAGQILLALLLENPAYHACPLTSTFRHGRSDPFGLDGACYFFSISSFIVASKRVNFTHLSRWYW